MIKEQQFWNWFKENEAKYLFLNQIKSNNEKELLLDEFLERLHIYCSELFFELGGYPDKRQDLIITAEGNVDFFDKVEDLVKQAPQLEHWNIIAFTPPMGNGIIDYKNIRLDPDFMYFDPLSSNNSTKIGLRIYIENYEPNNNEDFLTASYILINNILGEKSNALDIGYVEIENLPTSTAEREKLIEFSKLRNYIEWKKARPD